MTRRFSTPYRKTASPETPRSNAATPDRAPGRTPAVFPQTPASSRQDPGRFPIFPDDAPTAPDCSRRRPTPRPFPTDCGKLRPAPTAATAPVSFLRTAQPPALLRQMTTPRPSTDFPDAPDVRRPPGPLPRSPRPRSPRPAAFLPPPLVSRQSPGHPPLFGTSAPHRKKQYRSGTKARDRKKTTPV